MSDGAMGTAAPAAAPAAVPTEASKAPETSTPEEMIDLHLDGEDKPRKVPLSKLNPHLAKHRSEADRRMSEADKKAKAADERSTKLEAILKAAKEDPDGTLRELGIDPDEYSEKRLAAKVRAALREEEEKSDPTKKTAREADEERDQLRDENKKLKETQETAKREQLMGRLKGAVEAVRAKLPEALRGHATADVIAVMRQAIAEKKDPSLDDMAKAVRTLMRDRAKAAYESDDELRTLLSGKPAEKPIAKVIQHPASQPAARGPDGKFVGKTPDNDGAGDVLQQIMKGKF